MNITLFIHKDSSKTGITLKNAINKNMNKIKPNTLKSFSRLKSKLKQSFSIEEELLIILAESKNRLDELTTLIELLDNRRIILVLPDDSKETLSKASQFFPRFFTPVSESYDDLCSVLNKMTNQSNTSQYN